VTMHMQRGCCVPPFCNRRLVRTYGRFGPSTANLLKNFTAVDSSLYGSAAADAPTIVARLDAVSGARCAGQLHGCEITVTVNAQYAALGVIAHRCNLFRDH